MLSMLELGLRLLNQLGIAMVLNCSGPRAWDMGVYHRIYGFVPGGEHRPSNPTAALNRLLKISEGHDPHLRPRWALSLPVERETKLGSCWAFTRHTVIGRKPEAEGRCPPVYVLLIGLEVFILAKNHQGRHLHSLNWTLYTRINEEKCIFVLSIYAAVGL
ncbi:uncharacterized protein BO97DRAFT_411920 [Aspergillus homomorphus CBS 101889]|uniref:Uncharacterized protein n=1 Tax=Aspergillus homomorphus (strain CBS 101889) TaxID=1450537 RepID=A0A395I7A0_ASPHC|nr:hypothetical protein BO97DRAFT_411920 [Aspergillus homomorphus CBS 101889]RAL15163.1 hypothetical protein BO97DRAFT_411920 [Aspergillus homomorphus CBS 101889]